MHEYYSAAFHVDPWKRGCHIVKHQTVKIEMVSLLEFQITQLFFKFRISLQEILLPEAKDKVVPLSPPMYGSSRVAVQSCFTTDNGSSSQGAHSASEVNNCEVQK